MLLPDIAPADVAAIHVAEAPDPALKLAQLEHQIELQAAAIRDHLRSAPVVGQKEAAPTLAQEEPGEAGNTASNSDDASGASGSDAGSDADVA